MSPHLNIVLFEIILDPEKGIHRTSELQKSLTIMLLFPFMDSLNKNWASGKTPFRKSGNLLWKFNECYRLNIVLLSFFNPLSFNKALMLYHFTRNWRFIVLQGFQVYINTCIVANRVSLYRFTKKQPCIWHIIQWIDQRESELKSKVTFALWLSLSTC